ncbi:MAG: protein arginine kinase [Planctomycetota bacterium]
MELSDLDHRGGEWLRGGGPRSEIVISSRVRLARNLAGYPFANRASTEQKREILERLKERLTRLDFHARRHYVDLSEVDRIDSRFLVERHLISRELESGKGPRGVAFGADEVVSVMINEEDHLRIQAIRSSLGLENAWETALEVDHTLENDLEYAASTQHGYLTACPTNVGTGLRASVMLHLPALVHMKQIEKVFHAASRTGLAVRGFYGEGTMASGDLYQISNQVTLGRTEQEILKDLNDMLPQILDYEDRCRQELSSRGLIKLEDKVYRALATLRAARTLSSEEAMQYLSGVRLGTVMGILKDVDLEQVNDLFVLTQPAHLQKIEGHALDPEERDVRRAAFVRATLG